MLVGSAQASWNEIERHSDKLGHKTSLLTIQREGEKHQKIWKTSQAKNNSMLIITRQEEKTWRLFSSNHD
jgi:hypothetical protein